ncbi:hypothetical protein BDV95DRAFT_611599 [Massariosphaeria phaeospora]|uniref:DUF7607 domain-containing protein n=1 Tax=Massariosphaeria phaeospora TaxID=100035 RepID=A0A7C8MDA4_9PLEO|nr:hypothetical protein BDV95DRAFT_611599 [Massariosphaeria phaeospora]
MRHVERDPWFWSVDDLVSQLCRSSSLFQAAGYVNCPEPSALESQLRYHQVTGAAFLTGIQDDVLREELGIQQLGHRQALSAVVKHLRSLSPSYNQTTATAAVEGLSLDSNDRQPAESAISNDTGRKRQKVALTSTIPLPTKFTQSQDIVGVHAHHADKSRGNWDYLLDRYGEDDTEILPPLAAAAAFDQDDEDEDEDIDFMDDVDGEDQNHLLSKHQQSNISYDQVGKIINECITQYTIAWVPGKEVEHDPEKSWKEAKQADTITHLLETTHNNVLYFKDAIDRLCDKGFLDGQQWKNEDEVRRQCRSLETTINQLEHEKWSLNLYKIKARDEGNFIDGLSEHGSSDSESSANDHHALEGTSTQYGVIDLGSESESSVAMDQENDMSDDNGKIRPGTIDLTALEETELYGIAPPDQSYVRYGDRPEVASIGTVKRWNWEDLLAKSDRKRIIMKIILEMKADDREMIRNRIGSVRKQNLLNEIRGCVHMLAKGHSRMSGVLPRDIPRIVMFTKLYLSWWFAKDVTRQDSEPHPDILHCLEHGSQDLSIFYDWVFHVMGATFSQEALAKPGRPSQAEIIEISSDED